MTVFLFVIASVALLAGLARFRCVLVSGGGLARLSTNRRGRTCGKEVNPWEMTEPQTGPWATQGSAEEF